MKAICWQGKKDLRCEEVPDPKIEDPKDAIIRVTSTCICGSDLHLMNGFVPTMMHRIWSLPEEVRHRYDVSSLKTVFHMAAPMPLWLKEKWIEWLGPDYDPDLCDLAKINKALKKLGK